MLQPIFCGEMNNPNNNGSEQVHTLMSDNSQYATLSATTEAARSCVAPISGVLKNLYVLVATAPGSGKSWTVTLRVNGADTALSATISGNLSTSASNTSDEISINAGDLLTIKVVGTSSPTTSNLSWGIVWEGGTQEAVLMGSSVLAISSTDTNYQTVMGSTWAPTHINFAKQLCPLNGAVKNFRVNLTQAPGSGKSFTFTLQKNGVDTALVVTIADLDTIGSDTSTSVSVAAGDTLNLKLVPSGTPTSGTIFRFGMQLQPDVDGEAPVIVNSPASPDNSSTEFLELCGSGDWRTSESLKKAPCPGAFDFSDLYGFLTNAPGSGNSWTFAARKGISTQALTITIANSDTTGSDTSHTFSATAGQTLDYRSVPSSVPDINGPDTSLATALSMVAVETAGSSSSSSSSKSSSSSSRSSSSSSSSMSSSSSSRSSSSSCRSSSSSSRSSSSSSSSKSCWEWRDRTENTGNYTDRTEQGAEIESCPE